MAAQQAEIEVIRTLLTNLATATASGLELSQAAPTNSVIDSDPVAVAFRAGGQSAISYVSGGRVCYAERTWVLDP